MKLPVILRRIARAEFDDAADWTGTKGAGLARGPRSRPPSGRF
jgi:hypothetical protein